MADKIFSFTCPPERVEEATELLSGIEGVKLFSHREQTTNVVPDAEGKFVTNEGVEITGTCDGEQIKEIIGVLSSHKIAGYSRETMVILRDGTPQQSSERIN